MLLLLQAQILECATPIEGRLFLSGFILVTDKSKRWAITEKKISSFQISLKKIIRKTGVIDPLYTYKNFKFVFQYIQFWLRLTFHLWYQKYSSFSITLQDFPNSNLIGYSVCCNHHWKYLSKPQASSFVKTCAGELRVEAGNTSQQDFGTRKVYCVSNVTFHAESKYAIKSFPSPTVFVQWPF